MNSACLPSSSRGSRKVIVLAVALGAAALAAHAAPPTAAPALAPPAADAAALYTEWRIVQARTEPMLDTRRARLRFGADGRLVGHTSCNSLSAAFERNGDTLRIGAVVTTRMACARLQMEQEDRVLTALEETATARVRPDGLLELRDAEGRGVLRAVRADLPE